MKTRPVIVLFLACTLPSLALRGEEVIVNGAAGATGITHTDSQGFVILGSSGGAGGDGSPATAVANTAGQALNMATAKGGVGGSGGQGGAGQSNPLIVPGFGGAGGAGGGATATAAANRASSGGGDVEAVASAEGGIGGLWGTGGQTPQKDGATGAGGSSTASASAVTTTGKVTSSASAGQTGIVSGGSSMASATGSNTSDDGVSVTASAYGGPGKSSNRFAGTAGFGASLGTVSGSSSGGGAVGVHGYIFGGQGGSGPIQGGSGAAASLTDAVIGSTSGELFLDQQVTGGYGGEGKTDYGGAAGSGGAGGAASSMLSLTNTTASMLRLYVSASGGYGGWAQGGTAGAAGTATAQLHATGAHDVDATVAAVGGGGGGNTSTVSAPGAAGTVLPSSAASTGSGKTVRLVAWQQGGSGGWNNLTNTLSGGDGVDSTLTDIVSGSAPAGSLTLWQTAAGGYGGPSLSGVGGRGGDAQSTLNFTHSGENELVANVQALGSDAGWGGATNRTNSRGGHGTAASTVQDSGDVALNVDAWGGAGNVGGNASATGSARSTGTGKAGVSVTAYGGPAQANDLNATPGTATLSAYGESVSGDVTVNGTGNAGGAHVGLSIYPSPVTGRAITLSNAVSGRTAGLLYLFQTANGGLGTADVYDSNGSAGAGGNATSSLVMPGGNPGGGALNATAQASGGASQVSYETQTTGTPGSATAVCDLRNHGDVTALANAYGGGAGLGGLTSVPSFYGAAHATAKAVCTKPGGSAQASASIGNCNPATSSPVTVTTETLGGHVSSIKAAASKPPADNASLNAVVGIGAGGAGGSITGVGMPVTLPSLSGTPNAATALDGMTPLADVSATSSFATGSVALTLNTTSYTGNVKMALLSGDVWTPSAPLTSFQFTVSRGASQIVSQTFTTWAAAQAWFTDRVIDLGSAAAVNGQELTVSFAFNGISDTEQAGFFPRLIIGAKTALRAWAEGYGIGAGQDLGTHDADQDGLPDLVEWAFGLNPTQGESLQLPAAQAVGSNLVTSFTEPPGVTGITYGAEWSISLTGPWTPIPDTGTPPQHLFSVPTSDKQQVFMRLKVISP